MNKKFRRTIAAASAAAMIGTLGFVPVTVSAAGNTTTITPLMTYVDKNDADTAIGYVTQATTGYNKISGGNTIAFANESWEVNKVAYLKVDASGISDSVIANAILKVTADAVNRNHIYGIMNVPYTSWDDKLTYNIADANEMRKGTIIGDTVTVAKNKEEAIEFNFTSILRADDDRIITLAIYDTEAGGGNIKSPSVTIVSTNDGDDYIEPIAEATISGSSSMVFGSDPDTAANNAYSVVLKGESGTIITEENINSKVNDFNVKWDIEGFATDNDTEGQYCDSYGAFTKNNTGSTSTVFALKNVPMNFFGKMTATVTYNGETYTASKYVTALGNTTVASNQILPVGGYPSDFDEYPDSLVGYKTSGSETLAGGWGTVGSGSKSLEIKKESDNKFLSVAAGASGSHAVYKTISTPKSQIIFEQNIRFSSEGGNIKLTATNPTWQANKYSEAFVLNYSNSTLKLNGAAITKDDNPITVNANTWYKAVISADKTTETSYVKVYNMSGELVGETANIKWNASCVPTYFVLEPSNNGTIDFDNYSAYYPTADTNNYTLTASQDTLSIPNGDTADLVASLKTADGYDLTGAATWSVLEEDMQSGVIVTADENDSHKAKVTLTAAAEAGEAAVQVNIGGYTKTIVLNITSSVESVKFTKSNTSVSIPLDDTPITAEYAAAVINGEGKDLGRSTTLAVYDKNNTTEYTLPTGISFDAKTGILTVLKTAPPCTFTIRATGTNTDGEAVSKAVKVTVHGLAFDFGISFDDAVAEGYTPVGADTTYTAARGYGIKSGSVTAEGSATVDNADSDYLAGAFEFDANVTAGKMYNVEITYSGTLKTAYVNSDLAGYTLGNHKELTSATYTFAVPTDILDLSVSTYVDDKGTTDDTSDDESFAPSIASITITKNADRTARTKPVIHHIGDSTAANNGSWAHNIAYNRSSFPALDALATFYNNGAGGRNLCTYYTEGKLASVLNDIYPGDIVMFGNMGTNGLGTYFENDVNYYLDAAEVMGAKIIINSYTPHGTVSGYASGYNSSTHTFDSWRRDSGDPTTRKVAEERAANDPNYLGFVEIGKNADAIFNAYVADYAKNGYESADAAAQAIISCFGDHNHYSNGSVARNLMLNGYGDTKGIVEQIVDILKGWDVSVEKAKVAALADTSATGWMPTITNVSKAGQPINTINIAVTSDNETKTFTAKSGKDFNNIVLDANGAVKLIVIVEGIADENASLKLDVE